MKTHLTASNIQIAHGFTTRDGGVSQGHLASLNLGTHRGDKPENVMKNYEIMGKNLGFDVKKTVFTKQVHGDVVGVATQDHWGNGLFREVETPCDGMVTNVPGTVLVAFSADCTPVLLWDTQTNAVGAIHAGWRGTALGIVQKAVETMSEKFGTDPGNIHAAIGPCISRCCFETHGEVPQAMVEALGEEALLAIDQVGEKFHVDLKKINGIWLKKAGVTQVETLPHCTACHPDMFWSHRKVGDARGSLAAIIVCP